MMYMIIIIISITYVALQMTDMVTTFIFTKEIGIEYESNEEMRKILLVKNPYKKWSLFLLWYFLIISIPISMLLIFKDVCGVFCGLILLKIFWPKTGLISAVIANVKAIRRGRNERRHAHKL